jgi:hypothetical protein
MKPDKWGARHDYETELADTANRHCEVCRESVDLDEELRQCAICERWYSTVCCEASEIEGMCVECP